MDFCCCFFSPKLLLFCLRNRLKYNQDLVKKRFLFDAFYGEREKIQHPLREKRACLFSASEQPPNANTQKYESLRDENCHLRFPAIRFRFSPSRIGGNFKSFRLDKKTVRLLLICFSLPLSRTNTKFLPNVRVNVLKRARVHANNEI